MRVCEKCGSKIGLNGRCATCDKAATERLAELLAAKPSAVPPIPPPSPAALDNFQFDPVPPPTIDPELAELLAPPPIPRHVLWEQFSARLKKYRDGATEYERTEITAKFEAVKGQTDSLEQFTAILNEAEQQQRIIEESRRHGPLPESLSGFKPQRAPGNGEEWQGRGLP